MHVTSVLGMPLELAALAPLPPLPVSPPPSRRWPSVLPSICSCGQAPAWNSAPPRDRARLGQIPPNWPSKHTAQQARFAQEVCATERSTSIRGSSSLKHHSGRSRSTPNLSLFPRHGSTVFCTGMGTTHDANLCPHRQDWHSPRPDVFL